VLSGDLLVVFGCPSLIVQTGSILVPWIYIGGNVFEEENQYISDLQVFV
jgi:hypothetical protein